MQYALSLYCIQISIIRIGTQQKSEIGERPIKRLGEASVACHPGAKIAVVLTRTVLLVRTADRAQSTATPTKRSVCCRCRVNVLQPVGVIFHYKYHTRKRVCRTDSPRNLVLRMCWVICCHRVCLDASLPKC